jgi:hypothetical protein
VIWEFDVAVPSLPSALREIRRAVEGATRGVLDSSSREQVVLIANELATAAIANGRGDDTLDVHVEQADNRVAIAVTRWDLDYQAVMADTAVGLLEGISVAWGVSQEGALTHFWAHVPVASPAP